MNNNKSTFAHSITPKNRSFDLKLKEIWRYRDLLILFVRRDFVSKFKQTVLGPAWFFIQPLFQTIMFTFVFGNVAGLSTDGAPKGLFYLAGVTAWNYFSNCLKTTSNVFTINAALFGKVYFPRAVTPISIVISNLIQFGIGMILFLIVYFYYIIIGRDVEPNIYLLLFPALVLLMGVMGLGLGMLVSAMTTKYRDMQHLIQFGVQLLMYATPVVYPISAIPDKYQWIIMANPMSGIIEAFKYGFLGTGSLSWSLLAYSTIFSIFIFLFGLMMFNKTEKNFMDTV